MIYEPKEFTLRGGETVLLRSPRAEDAAAIIDHMRRTSAETPFMARYPEEVSYTEAEEANILEFVAHSPMSMMLCAEAHGEIIANASVMPIAAYRKYLHRGEFGISIRFDYCSRGLGTIMLGEIIAVAEQSGLTQLELEVCTENPRALALYEKLGFRRYGLRPRSLKLDSGKYLDEALMLRELNTK